MSLERQERCLNNIGASQAVRVDVGKANVAGVIESFNRGQGPTSKWKPRNSQAASRGFLSVRGVSPANNGAIMPSALNTASDSAREGLGESKAILGILAPGAPGKSSSAPPPPPARPTRLGGRI